MHVILVSNSKEMTLSEEGRSRSLKKFCNTACGNLHYSLNVKVTKYEHKVGSRDERHIFPHTVQNVVLSPFIGGDI